MTTDPIYAASPISTVDFSLGGLLPDQDAHYLRRLHAPPRAVGMPRSFNPTAIARSDVPPAAGSSAMIGADLAQALLRRSLRWPRCPAARIDFSLSPSAGDLHRASHKITRATT
jgi:hypothetical protein